MQIKQKLFFGGIAKHIIFLTAATVRENYFTKQVIELNS